MESYVSFWVFNIVSFIDFVFNVCNQWVFYLIDIVVFNSSVMLCVVRELRVDRNIDYFYIFSKEVFVMVVECNQFRWVNESEVQWVEENNCFFIFCKFCEVEVINDFIVIKNSSCSKIRGFVINQYYFFVFK